MTGWHITLLPLLPTWLIPLVLLGLLGLLAHGCQVLARKQVPRRWLLRLAVLRLLAIVLVAGCLYRPVINYHRELDGGPALLVLGDTSASMAGHPDATTSKLAGLAEALTNGPLGEALDGKFQLASYAFDRDARPVPLGDLAAQPVTGASTQLASSLQTAWSYQQQSGEAASEGTKVLLLHDGHDHGAGDPVAVAQALGLRLYPLAPPSPPSEGEPPSLTLSAISSPQRVLLGSEARFEVTLRATGAAGVPLLVELLENGQPVAQRGVTLAAGEREHTLVLPYRPSLPGTPRYTVRLAPAEAHPTLTPAAPYEMSVEIHTQQHRVLLLEDAWRWQFRYLRRLLEEDPSFTYAAFLARGPGVYWQFAEPDNPVKLAGFPRGRAELQWFEVIVLGEVRTQNWPAGLAATLRDLVVEDGRSLVILAGPGLQTLARDPALGGLLPVELGPRSAVPVPGPINLRLTPEGRASPFFYTPGATGGPDRWADLPPMDQIYMPLRKRPGATVLLDAPDQVNEYGSAIVLAEHRVGKGRVLFVGTDTLWQWQSLGVADDEDNTPHAVFWRQALRALAPLRVAEGEVSVWPRADRGRYAVGDTVSLTVDLQSRDASTRPSPKATVKLPDGRELPLALTPDPQRDGQYLAEFEATMPGAYAVSVAAQVAGRTLADRMTTIEVSAAQGEDPRLAPNLNALRRLASATGGQVVDLADPSTWPSHEQPDQLSRRAARTFDPWSSFTLLLLLVLVLGTDWLLRLIRGFV